MVDTIGIDSTRYRAYCSLYRAPVAQKEREMEMSAACTPPVHAEINASDRQHPRFHEYMQYRAAMTQQLVTCQPFASWLWQTEQHEQGHECVFQVTRTDAALAPGWYKNKFAPRKQMPSTFGPFATQA